MSAVREERVPYAHERVGVHRPQVQGHEREVDRLRRDPKEQAKGGRLHKLLAHPALVARGPGCGVSRERLLVSVEDGVARGRISAQMHS